MIGDLPIFTSLCRAGSRIFKKKKKGRWGGGGGGGGGGGYKS